MFINTILLGLSLSTLLQSTYAQEADLQTCLSTAGIQTIRPVPTAVAYPQTETDIVASLKCATEAGVKVSALSGGHSFVSYGMGGEDGALVLNMTAFQSLSYDETTGYLTVGGGSHVAPAATYLWKNYRAHFPHVRGNWVGIASSTIGGGLGTTSRFLGTTLDNLVAVTMVLANGTIVTASDTENSDLFFAVRGAGSSFGVLLTLTLKTWKPTYPNVTKWTITMPSNTTLDSGAKALLAVQEYELAESTPDEMYIRWRVTVPSWGGAGYFYGNPDYFASVIAPLMDVLPEGTTLTSSVADFWTMENDNTGGINLTYDSSPSRTFYVKAFVLTDSHPFTYESAVALYNGTSLAFARDNRTDISKSGLLDLWGSRSNSARSSTTKSNPSDGNLWIVRWEGVLVGTDSARGQKSLYTQDAVNYISGGLDPFLEQLAAEGGSPRGYANYRNSELSVEEWSEQLYPGGNYEKLKSIKAIVDPGELFNPNAQSIPAS